MRFYRQLMKFACEYLSRVCANVKLFFALFAALIFYVTSSNPNNSNPILFVILQFRFFPCAIFRQLCAQRVRRATLGTGHAPHCNAGFYFRFTVTLMWTKESGSLCHFDFKSIKECEHANRLTGLGRMSSDFYHFLWRREKLLRHEKLLNCFFMSGRWIFGSAINLISTSTGWLTWLRTSSITNTGQGLFACIKRSNNSPVQAGGVPIIPICIFKLFQLAFQSHRGTLAELLRCNPVPQSS